VDHDPHADAIQWHGPSVSSVTEPDRYGHFEDAEPCRVLELKAGWHAHKLNAPGKFPISAPGTAPPAAPALTSSPMTA
jgi:hypothetical protein